jgi:glyoxylase-like metal-dependent hydrolase (beta-lactamase superfamily II)
MKIWNTNNCTIYQVLEGRSNSFLVNQENNYILIDTGRRNSWRELTTKLNGLLGENELSCLILTHTHFDHAENANRLKKKYNCKIIVHESESNYLKSGDTPLPKGTNLATGFMVDVLGKKMQSRYKYEPADPDILVGEKLDLDIFGLNSHIIHSPGHSKGSMSIIIDDEIALVGDTLFCVFGNSIFPPFADDAEIMIENWKKLLETGCKLFLPGHGKLISRELLEKQYAKHKM